MLAMVAAATAAEAVTAAAEEAVGAECPWRCFGGSNRVTHALCREGSMTAPTGVEQPLEDGTTLLRDDTSFELGIRVVCSIG